MRTAVIVYHSNLFNYPSEWIDQFRESILNQTYKEFDLFELNYSDTDDRIFEESRFSITLFNNHAEAMNHMLDMVFGLGYDAVFNTNVDDVYSLDRLEKQLPYLLTGWDIVSSNFSLFNDSGVFHTHHFEDRDIKKELDKEHNVICHPVVAYSKNFWKGNRYKPEEIPVEDLRLWQRSIDQYSFIILNDVLCYHREHENATGRKR